MADTRKKGFWGRFRNRLAGQGNKPAGQDNQAGPTRPAEAPALTADGKQQDTPRPSNEAGDGATSILSTSELKTDTVGRVYAEALIELAREQDAVDEIAAEVQQLLPLLVEDGELYRLLTNPAIGDSERSKIVERVFSGKVSPLLYKMLRVLSDKDRLGSLPQVAAGYLLAVSAAQGQVEVQAFIASELDSEAARKVAEQIGQALGKTVSLTQKIDPSLIGGLKIKIGDQLIDASVASQLRGMKNKMIAAGRG